MNALVERKALSEGKQAVIAVANAQGNPVAVHVMDGAFLVSYEVAVRKAYTAVAVKMPTAELARLVQPGGTFYGLQNLDRIVTFGGGVPLYENGVLIGGLRQRRNRRGGSRACRLGGGKPRTHLKAAPHNARSIPWRRICAIIVVRHCRSLPPAHAGGSAYKKEKITVR